MEKRMSKSGRIVLVVAVLAALAACARQEEVEVVEPVTVEPTYTGKYK
jgi:type IV pilus biogenesis protein CpaD/CtpE